MQNKSGTCALCLKENVRLTKEHIIPYSLGNNHFTIDCLCEECNSVLGRKLDAYIVNSFPAKAFRDINGLKGHSGAVPFAFENGKLSDGSKITKRNGKIVKKTNVKDDGKNISITAPSLEEATRIANGIMSKRYGRTLSEEEIKELSLQSKKDECGEITLAISIDLNLERMELLKIVFETFVFFFDYQCLKDQGINKMREVLLDFVQNDIIDEEYLDTHFYQITDEFINIFNKSLKSLSKESPNDVFHFLYFLKRDDCFMVVPFIQGILSFVIKLNRDNNYFVNTLLTISKNYGILPT